MERLTWNLEMDASMLLPSEVILKYITEENVTSRSLVTPIYINENINKQQIGL